ncbi:hypothetical protein KIPB_011337 [Kipferlia bialata]|uniref:Uncharacterized protein n=1 Tax=Kipferlia bialata TaxID=797122 RepID=A0A9K3GNN8_9EUKA|nr:hypothetical protein KIPB_011337 [Kipferlia bialata]|eukprot:g11337.t1
MPGGGGRETDSELGRHIRSVQEALKHSGEYAAPESLPRQSLLLKGVSRGVEVEGQSEGERQWARGMHTVVSLGHVTEHYTMVRGWLSYLLEGEMSIRGALSRRQEREREQETTQVPESGEETVAGGEEEECDAMLRLSRRIAFITRAIRLIDLE